MASRVHPNADALILDLWEGGAAAPPLDRALMLLAYARPDMAEGERLDMALGARDRAIAAFRAELLGPSVELAATCPHCGGGVELVLADAAAVLEAAAGREPSDALAPARPVTSADLKAAAAAAAAGEDPRAALAARLGFPAAGLAAEAIDRALETVDPAAELRLELACPECGGAWTAVFDVADCAWREIAAEGAKVADEVAALARAYGWRETDTLAMSRARRRIYLERAPT